MAEDLLHAQRVPEATVATGDARDPDAWSRLPRLADACVTSPPYLNQLSYAEALRLESYFLRPGARWSDLAASAKPLVPSCVQQVVPALADPAWERLHEAAPELARELRELCADLSRKAQERAQPKRYDLLVPLYFASVLRVLRNLHSSLRDGARAAWVVGDSAPYGVSVDTPRLIAELAAQVGFAPLDDRVLYSRGQRWQVAHRHNEQLTERLVTFQR